jgi:60 kDa SS-A/Ro ribonucleoprotein
MKPEACLRNLGRMASLGLFEGVTAAEAFKMVTAILNNKDNLIKHRVHPISVLLAWKMYQQERGDKGSLKWTAEASVLQLLEQVFYVSFAATQHCNKQLLIAVDSSSSMTWAGVCGIRQEILNPRIASMAMALVLQRSAEYADIVSFTSNGDIAPMALRGASLDTAVEMISTRPCGGTDCSLPIQYAIKQRTTHFSNKYDAIIIFTDNETNSAGSQHAVEYLQEYRTLVNHDVKLIVVAATATKSSIANVDDANSLDIVGFNASVPAAITYFLEN